jgi:predicted NUDIX family NTP pyrophosphohydrolase
MQWPPHSGRFQEFPELDRVGWFALDAARDKLVKGQRIFLDRLGQSLE